MNQAYLAGFFDGEGCAALYWHKAQRKWKPEITITLKRDTRNVTLLSSFCRLYAVKLSLTERTCRFRIARRATLLQFIEDVLPFTALKTTQLLLLRTFLEEGGSIYAYRIAQQLKSQKRRE